MIFTKQCSFLLQLLSISCKVLLKEDTIKKRIIGWIWAADFKVAEQNENIPAGGGAYSLVCTRSILKKKTHTQKIES